MLFNPTIMKNIFIVAAVIVSAAACQRAMLPASTPVLNTEVKNESGQPILAGHCSPAALQKPNYKDWFDKSFSSYTIDSPIVRQLRPLLKGKSMEVFLGSWCGDSKREVPRMLKILVNAGLDTTKIALIFVDNSPKSYKQSPQHEEKDKNIHHVPTFIMYDGKKEIGRIIESPLASLEKDMLAILTGQSYQPNYQAISYWRAYAAGRDKDLSDAELQSLVPELKTRAKHSGEFNTYGYMQLAAKNQTEAMNVFRLNTLLYPDNANAFGSLAEAWATIGNKPAAIEAYEKQLALKPADEVVKKKIAELKM
jgi:hypothetical protein